MREKNGLMNLDLMNYMADPWNLSAIKKVISTNPYS